MAVKYSIPSNYIVEDMGGAKGIIRQSKNGEEWLWQPAYTVLLTAKCYGKNFIGYKSVLDGGNDYIAISNYNKTEILPLPVYDVLFGEKCLYIRTIHAKDNEVKWCLVRSDLGGGQFLCDFEILSRSQQMPHHIPVGTDAIKIKLENGRTKKLVLSTGKIVENDDVFEREVYVRPIEPPVTSYDIVVDKESSRFTYLNPHSGKEIKQSNIVIGLDEYEDLFFSIFGGKKNVDKSRVDKFDELLYKFEYCFDGRAIVALYKYIENYYGFSAEEDIADVLDVMEKELTAGYEHGYKIFTVGASIVVLSKDGEGGKITATVKKVSEVSTIKGLEDLLEYYRAFGKKTTKLSIERVVEIPIEQDKVAMSLPFPIKNRQEFAKTIKKHDYEQKKLIKVECRSMANTGENVAFAVLVGKKFKYVSNKRVAGKLGDYVSTNTNSIQLM